VVLQAKAARLCVIKHRARPSRKFYATMANSLVLIIVTSYMNSQLNRLRIPYYFSQSITLGGVVVGNLWIIIKID
jgi:hypothetical protein